MMQLNRHNEYETRRSGPGTEDNCLEATGSRVTATEMIDGVRHLLVLEQDETGCFREVTLEPVGLHKPRTIFA